MTIAVVGLTRAHLAALAVSLSATSAGACGETASGGGRTVGDDLVTTGRSPPGSDDTPDDGPIDDGPQRAVEVGGQAMAHVTR